jgi:DNA-binding MarR family transcriptional regulator
VAARTRDEPAEDQLAAWVAVLHGQSALVGVLDHELMNELGLPLTWYDVLVQLHAAGGRMRMQELARSIVLSKSGLTRLVDRMVAAGLVSREPCEGDRRGLLAVLTDEGAATLRRAAPVHLQGIEDHFGSLVSPEEAAVVRSVFERVLSALQDGGQCDDVLEASA